MSQFGFWSYGAAALAFALLSLLLAISWRGKRAGALLTAAAVGSTCWGASAALGALSDRVSFFTNLTELLRAGFWFAFLAVLLISKTTSPKAVRTKWPVLFWCGVVVVLVTGALEIFIALSGHHASATSYFGLRVMLAIIGLMLVEQLYRSTPADSRWMIKFLCLGVGALFAYDLVLYSDAMLFHVLDRDLWIGRGLANALIVPLVAVSAARNPTWSLDIAVSRRVVFQSTALLGAGAYLLGVAGAGYYLRFFGGTWGGVLQAVVLFSGLVGLILLATSGTLRAQMRVFVNKNFFSYRYDYREEWLRMTRDLSASVPDDNFGQRSIRALANLVESPGGALWLEQENQNYERMAQWNAAALDGVEIAGSDFIEFLRARQWVINLDDYRDDHRTDSRNQSRHYESFTMPEWLHRHPDTWLVIPLIFQDKLLGFVVLLRARVALTIDWEVNDLLKTAGRQVAGYLAQLRATQALLVARQFESFNRMSAFVVHDLKNLIAQLSLIIANAAKHRNNPEFQQDMLETVHNASEKMKRLLSQLRVGAAPVEQPIAVDVIETVRKTIASKMPLTPVPMLTVETQHLRTLAHPERLERVIGHLVQNAAEATPANGSIAIRVKNENESAIIEIEDTGCGMSPEFIRDRLFRPFESTKQNGMGIGIYESREYLRELGGSLEVRSREHEGSCFCLRLPLLKTAADA